MINNQRLSRYITSREVKKAQNSLLGMYDSLSEKQRQEIREMLEKNKNS